MGNRGQRLGNKGQRLGNKGHFGIGNEHLYWLTNCIILRSGYSEPK